MTAFGCDDPKDNKKCSMTMSPCPADRHVHAADGLVNPRVPNWNATASGVVPAYMTKEWPPLTAYEAQRQDMGFRNRTGSAMDLDDMLGVVLDGLDALGPDVVANTYVIFTSDNGFHLGEHRMVFGAWGWGDGGGGVGTPLMCTPLMCTPLMCTPAFYSLINSLIYSLISRCAVARCQSLTHIIRHCRLLCTGAAAQPLALTRLRVSPIWPQQ